MEKTRLYGPSQFLDKDLDFENNSLIEIIDVNSEYKQPQAVFYDKKDLMKNELQELIVRNTQQLQISSALKIF